MTSGKWIAVAASFLALAGILGAFAAHGLGDKLDAYSLGVYEKAVFYHFIHAMGLFMVALLPALRIIPDAAMFRICLLLAVGILLFSGSLYLLAVSGNRWLGAITPLGGTAFIIAWLMLAYELLVHTSDGV